MSTSYKQTYDTHSSNAVNNTDAKKSSAGARIIPQLCKEALKIWSLTLTIYTTQLSGGGCVCSGGITQKGLSLQQEERKTARRSGK